ncbi:hypothetical protein Tco_1525862 [Tanacetum coccineum]
MVVIYNHHTHPLVAAVVVVYDDVRVAVLGLPWGGSGRGDGDGDGDDAAWVARDLVGCVDRGVGSTFGLAGKTPPEKYSGGGGVVVARIRRRRRGGAVAG